MINEGEEESTTNLSRGGGGKVLEFLSSVAVLGSISAIVFFNCWFYCNHCNYLEVIMSSNLQYLVQFFQDSLRFFLS